MSEGHDDSSDKKLTEFFTREKVAAAASKLFWASVGELIGVFSASPSHKFYTIADLEWMVLPAATLNQFLIIEATSPNGDFHTPVAAAAWAFVCEETERKLLASSNRPVSLRPDEWNNGPTAWLVDCIGSPAEVPRLLMKLAEGPFKEIPLKMFVKDSAGNASPTTLQDILADRSVQSAS